MAKGGKKTRRGKTTKPKMPTGGKPKAVKGKKAPSKKNKKKLKEKSDDEGTILDFVDRTIAPIVLENSL